MPRRGENIYKRKDGRWEARYVKEITVDGKKKYGSVYAKSYCEVKAKQQSRILRPFKSSADSINIIVSKLMGEWLESINKQVKPSTLQKYIGISKNHIVPLIGTVPVRLISNSILRSFTDNLSMKNKKLSNKTINDILTVLGLALKYAENEYEILTPTIHYLKTEQKEMRVLSYKEQQTLTNYLYSNMDTHSFGILLALHTGIRVGELCALTWEDITEKYIKINKTMMRIKKSSGKTEIKTGPPKSKKSNRFIPTPESLIPLIKHFQRGDNQYVLSNGYLSFTEPRLMQYKFEKIIEKCNLPKTNFHALRHTFATRCVEAGVDAKTLSELLGHSDVKTTLNRYVHSSFDLKQKCMLQLEKSLKSI